MTKKIKDTKWLTVNIPEELHNHLSMMCRKRRMTMKEAIVGYIKFLIKSERTVLLDETKKSNYRLEDWEYKEKNEDSAPQQELEDE